MPFHNNYRFNAVKGDTVESLRQALNETHSKLQRALTDIERSGSSSGNTVILLGGGSSSSGGGGSAVSADNVRAGTQVLTSAGGTVTFSSPLTGYSNVVIWAWLLADGMTVFAEVGTITISGFTVGAIPGGLSGTVYYIAVGY